MDLQISGRKALVCGASKGMGRAIAVALAHEGADLFLCARSKESLESVSRDIQSATGKTPGWQPCDLLDQRDRDSLIQTVLTTMGSVDILVHNVGGPKTSLVQETSLSDWESGFAHLFLPVAHLNEAFLPGMKERHWGRILLITSLSVVEPIPGLAISNAIRSAATAMCKTLSDEVASYNITVNCVAPGWINTDRTEELLESRAKRSGQSREEYFRQHLATIPARRMGTAEELASVVCFLASEGASYINGSTIFVDGGKRRSTY